MSILSEMAACMERWTREYVDAMEAAVPDFPPQDLCPWCGRPLDDVRQDEYPFGIPHDGGKILAWVCGTCPYGEDHAHKPVFGYAMPFLLGKRPLFVKWPGPSIYG